MDNYKFTLTYDGTDYPLTDLGNYFDYSFSEKKEDEQIFFRQSFDSELHFTKSKNEEIYNILEGLFDSNSCDEVVVKVEKKCNGGYVDYWQGVFTSSQMTFNKCECSVYIKPKVDDEYTCILNNWDKVVNIYRQSSVSLDINDTCVILDPILQQSWTIPNNILRNNTVVFPNTLSGSLGYELTTNDTAEFEYFDTGLNAYVDGQKPKAYWPLYTSAVDNGDGTSTVTTVWRRELYDCAGSPPSGQGWVYDSIDERWARKPLPINNEGMENLSGIPLEFALERAIERIGCDVDCIVSDFLNINADDTHPNNDAYTYAEDNLKFLNYQQKSEIVNIASSDPATIESYKIVFGELIDDLCKQFNLIWYIEGGCMRIEHRSYLDSGAIDLPCTEICNLKPNLDIPQRESFSWMDDKQSDFFNGEDIVYSTNCSNADKEEIKIENFSNDINYIAQNPDRISLDGFVLIATDGAGNVIDNNRPLSFTRLHENLFLHNRYLPSFTMNGESKSAITTRPLKLTNPIPCKCSPCELDPNSKVNTEYGEATIIEIKEDMHQWREITLGL